MEDGLLGALLGGRLRRGTNCILVPLLAEGRKLLKDSHAVGRPSYRLIRRTNDYTAYGLVQVGQIICPEGNQAQQSVALL